MIIEIIIVNIISVFTWIFVLENRAYILEKILYLNIFLIKKIKEIPPAFIILYS